MMLGHFITLVGTSDTFFCDVSIAAYIYILFSLRFILLNISWLQLLPYHRIVGGDA